MKITKNPLDVTVNFYNRHSDQHHTEVNLYEFLTDKRYKDQVLALRSESDPVKQRAMKDKLPLCTVSGLFGDRNADSLLSATDLICIDIDAKDNTDISNFSNLKELIKECPYVLFCARSARGEGYFCIVQIADHKKFLGHFLSLERDFKRTGIVIDNSCKNINRLRYASYDPEPYICLNATVYDRVVKVDKRVKQNAVSADKITSAYRVGLLTGLLGKQGKDVTDSYTAWFNMACAIANEFGEDGRSMFHNLSKNHSDYNSVEADAEFDKALRYHYDQVSIESIFAKSATNYGVSLKDYLL